MLTVVVQSLDHHVRKQGVFDGGLQFFGPPPAPQAILQVQREGFFDIFVDMKLLVIILSLLFSLFSGGEKRGIMPVPPSEDASVITTTPAPDNSSDRKLNSEMCLSASQGWSFSGSEHSSSFSLRIAKSLRRTNQSTKTSSRLVRSGKIIDTHNYCPFLSALFLKTCGAYSFFRYIYSICCLRI